MFDTVSGGQKVLLLWSGSSPAVNLQDVVQQLNNKVGENGKVQLEHVDRLSLSNLQDSTFDVVLSGLLLPGIITHSADILATIAKVLKPNGILIVREPVTQSNDANTVVRTSAKLISSLKLSGFVDVAVAKSVDLDESVLSQIKASLKLSNEVNMVEVVSSKPGFEVGSSSQLSFAKKPKTEVNSSKATNVWTLSASDMADDDLDLVDEDDLLDEDDLKKPDPESLRADCGTGTGKKKACKNW
uniref:Anamorsin homolog n=1 Tax=Saccoglossus kowalevskii TaxID=10224 RepID=A0ABM0MMF9_SACKO|nr:PREDICTED: anamorsin homolog [Saccoglossus kowalevskii]